MRIKSIIAVMFRIFNFNPLMIFTVCQEIYKKQQRALSGQPLRQSFDMTIGHQERNQPPGWT